MVIECDAVWCSVMLCTVCCMLYAVCCVLCMLWHILLFGSLYLPVCMWLCMWHYLLFGSLYLPLLFVGSNIVTHYWCYWGGLKWVTDGREGWGRALIGAPLDITQPGWGAVEETGWGSAPGLVMRFDSWAGDTSWCAEDKFSLFILENKAELKL